MNRFKHKNFAVAIYTRAYEVALMSDLNYLKENFSRMSQWLKIDKVYLETHRDLLIPDEATILPAKKYLEDLGVQVAGGITITVNERNRFETYCYTNPEHRLRLKELSAYTARLFDEFILDDFFFTNCKCPSCVASKGERSWTQFRLELMNQAAQELVLEPARAANPKVKVVIKYPNWYEHFQGLGFDLDQGPKLFDGIYTGCETRDARMSNQHLQEYQGYLLYRYFENIKPGANGGGWVDPFGSRYLDRYAEQLWMPLFAGAKEVALFDFRSLVRSIQESERAPWQGQETSFDFDRMLQPLRTVNGAIPAKVTLPLAAETAFETVDPFLDKLGNPVGLKVYKPVNSTGEDFLPNYLGMLGIPLELTPHFPSDENTLLLAESARFDPEIIAKIKNQLLAGKTVVITSGLLRELQGKGIEEFVELRVTERKQTAQQFLIGWFQVLQATRPIQVPIIHYLTNDSWEEISCMGGETGTPLLHSARYGKGQLIVLVIPDNFSDLYCLPVEVLNRIKEIITPHLYVRLEAPPRTSLFVYDNDTFIAESFMDDAIEARVVLEQHFSQVEDVLSGEVLTGEDLLDWRGQPSGMRAYAFPLKPHSFRVFKASKG